ncbi:MAG: prepilin-type N-terminal cleavage/methylation domain-containing protein [bacterium]|nr:prepilin-type N-terminal cleavage/methylation domain-containing protein [bacterium]
MSKQGFTLIELMITVAIVGILAAIALPNYTNSLIKAKAAKAEADMNALSTAIESYRIDHNRYPSWTDPDGTHKNPVDRRLIPLTTPMPYMSVIPVDPFISVWEYEAYTTYDYVDAWSSIHYKKDSILDVSFRCSEWRLASAGPDGRVTFGSAYSYNLTNGLRSIGDIVRTGPIVKFPCVPFLRDR